MPYPFPGMNPYLEEPELWPGVHGRLIVAMSDHKLLRIYYVLNILSPLKNEFIKLLAMINSWLVFLM
ncbi:DUF4058 family protein [Nostoc sp.]|uniref:DUF4058 family protein n=1 Tax=Nostoc sp. TaxID=1180 RepID=UPI002FF4FCF9